MPTGSKRGGGVGGVGVGRGDDLYPRTASGSTCLRGVHCNDRTLAYSTGEIDRDGSVGGRVNNLVHRLTGYHY